MTNSKFFRIAGWCALAGAVTMVAAVLSFSVSGRFLTAGLVGGIFEYISLLLLIFVFDALYIALKPVSSRLSLFGLILLVVAIVVDVIANLSNTGLFNLWYLLLSIPFLIYGYLAFRSASISRGFAVMGLLTGASYFIAGVSGILGWQNLVDSISSISAFLMLVWEVWVWRVLWSQKILSLG